MRAALCLVPLFALAACTAKNNAATDTGAAATHDTGAAAMMPAANNDAAKAEVGKIRSNWMENANKKDAATVASYYSDDATFVGTESPLAAGRAAIQKSLGESFAVSKIESIDSKDFQVSGDIAYDYGTFKQTVTPPNAKAQTINGYYAVILHRQSDGTWKITHHVSTTPPAKP